MTAKIVMKNYKKRILCLIMVFMVVLSVMVVYPSIDVNAQEQEDVKITSIEQYYDKLAKQIYDRDA